MDKLFFFLSHYLALSALAVLSYTFGRRLTLSVSYHSRLEQVSFSVSLGLGFVSYLVFFLGLLGLLYRSVVLIALLVCFLMCYRIWIRWPGNLLLALSQIRRANRASVAIAIAIAIAVFTFSFYIWILPLYPPTAFDSTLYHLPAAKIYAQTHRLVLLDYLRLPIFPQANHMLFTLALLIYDDILAQLIELLMLIIIIAAIVAFGKRMFSDRAAYLAAALLMANTSMILLASVAYIDMGLTLYTTMTVYAFWNWLESRQDPWLVLAGAFCGIGIGTKYSALFFLAALTLLALFAGLRKRKWRPPLIFVGVTLLVAAPWFLRNFYYTRNPLFPLFASVFATVFGYGSFNVEYYREIAVAFSYVELGAGWHLLLTLPWQLAYNKGFASFYLFLLPLSLVFAIVDRRIRFLLALTAGFTLCWYFAFQQYRYLVPALPLLSLAVAAPIDRLLEWLPLKEKLWNHKLITAAACAMFVYPGWRYSRDLVRFNGTVPTTQSQRDMFLTRAFPTYPLVKHLNDLGNDDYIVYAMYSENLNYHSDGRFIGDWFGPAKYGLILNELTSGEALYNHLKALDADYFLAKSRTDWRHPNKITTIDLPSDSFFQTHFKPIYKANDAYLFQLTAVPFTRKIDNLLQNAGFENLNSQQPTGWQFAGEPIIDSSGQQSFAGQASVRCNRSGDVIYQRIPTKTGEYAFSCEARGLKQPGTVKLQANWYDNQGRLVTEAIKLFQVGVDWTHCETSFEAPANATSVITYASPLDPGPVWFDDFAFGKIIYEARP